MDFGEGNEVCGVFLREYILTIMVVYEEKGMSVLQQRFLQEGVIKS